MFQHTLEKEISVFFLRAMASLNIVRKHPQRVDRLELLTPSTLALNEGFVSACPIVKTHFIPLQSLVPDDRENHQTKLISTRYPSYHSSPEKRQPFFFILIIKYQI